MPEWPSLEPSAKHSDPEGPRFNPVLLAIPLGLFLLFNLATGRIDIVDAFDPDDGGLRAIVAEYEQAAATEVAGSQAPIVIESASAATIPGGAAPPALVIPEAQLGACRPDAGENFCLHEVQEGDSLASVATDYDLDGGAVPGWELLFQSNHADLADLDVPLQPGQILRVPVSRGILHTVFPGESVGELAVDYDVSSEDIVAANGLSDPDAIAVGDILLVPEPQQVPPLFVPEPDPTATPEGDEGEGEATEEGTPEADETPEGETEEPAESAEEPDDSDQAREDEEDEANEEDAGEEDQEADDEDGSDGDEDEEDETPAPDDASRMDWPVVQPVRVTNYMSARHPLGIDLGLAANPRSNITAAASGTVSFAGGDPCCSYGLYVIIDHGDGMHSLYAHLSTLDVQKGDSVARGDSLGIAGNTGYSRGVHLHFEVRLNGDRVDPMNYLPRN